MTDKLCHAVVRLVLSAGLVGAVWLNVARPLALNPAFVASPSSLQAVSTEGFNRGERK